MSKKRRPKWVDRPFMRFKTRVVELSDVVRISVHGIGLLRKQPALVEALVVYDKVVSPDRRDDAADKEELRRAKIDGALATRELKRGFPLLYGQATVSLWALLEDFSRSFLATWLRRKPTARRIEIVQKIQIRLVEFEELGSEERYEHIVSVLEATTKAGGKKFLGRFERVLEIFGLAGSVNQKTRRTLHELSSFRHALAHGRTHVDRRLSRECRWLRLDVGKPITVSHKQFMLYVVAVLDYGLSVWAQVSEKYGVDFAKEGAVRIQRKST